MVSFLSFVTHLALASIVLASPLKRNLVVSGENIVSSRELGNLEKRAGVDCSDSTQSSFISASLSEAKTLANIAINYINSFGTSDSLFVTYFGATDSSSTQLEVFSRVASEKSLTLSCTDPSLSCEGGIAAYTIQATAGIYYCSDFYEQKALFGLCTGTPVDSLRIRGGTTLHEATILLSETDESAVGCSEARSLASSDPNAASQNADNYNVRL